MTTTVRKSQRKVPARTVAAKTARVPKAKKPIRIKKEFLPDSAAYITVNDMEYIAIPVGDFKEWYEEVEIAAVLEDRRRDAEPSLPFDRAVEEIRKSRRAK